MIKILFAFGACFAKGGTEAVMLNIFSHIDRSKFHIDFLLMSDTPDDSPEAKYLQEQGAEIFYIPRRGTSYIEHRKALAAFFKNHQYDIVHSHMDATGAEVLRMAKRAGVKVRMTHSHNTNHNIADSVGIKQKLHRLYVDMEILSLRKVATHFIACSKVAGQWLFGEKIVSSNPNYLALNNAIDLDKYSYSQELRNESRSQLELTDEILFGHVGRFEYQKNHDLLIDIFDGVEKKNPNVKLLLIGEGSLQENVKQKVNKLGLSDKVIFLGQTGNVPAYLQAMDLFLFPSRYEGLSVAIVEAQATGLQCVSSKNISLDSDVSGNLLLLEKEASLEDWVDGCIKTIEKIKEVPRMSPRERIIECGFDSKSNFEKLEAFYEEAVRR